MESKEYQQLVQERLQPSKTGKNILWAFGVGGGICTLAQGLMNLYQSFGVQQEQAGTLASISLIVLSGILTGLGLFDKLAKHAGAGTLVPITGFANAMVSPALEFKTEGLITGTSSKLFVVAGPVLVSGITASVIYGLVLVLLQSGM